MVRRTLVETLNEQARQFLEEGRAPANETPEQNLALLRRKAFDVFERALRTGFWNEDDKAQLRRHVLQRLRTDWEQAGIPSADDGLPEAPTSPGALTTRGLEKELRHLRRELSLLSELFASLIQTVRVLAGCNAEQLRDFLCERPVGAAAAPTNGAPELADSEAPAAEEHLPPDDRSPEEPPEEARGAATWDETEIPIDAPRHLAEETLPPSVETAELEEIEILEEPEPPEASGELACPRCGRAVSPNAQRCLKCGKRF